MVCSKVVYPVIRFASDLTIVGLSQLTNFAGVLTQEDAFFAHTCLAPLTFIVTYSERIIDPNEVNKLNTVTVCPSPILLLMIHVDCCPLILSHAHSVVSPGLVIT